MHQHRVEQGEEITAARRVVAELELRPATLVERLLVERAGRAHREHRRIGLSGVGVALGTEEHFATTELRLVGMRTLRVPQHQFVERRHRGIGVTRNFGGARELVQRRIARCIVRIVAQQFLVRGDRLAGLRLRRCVRRIAHGAEHGGLLEAQVAEPAQCLRLQGRVRAVDLQERFVTVRGVIGRRLHGQRAIHRRGAAGERPERRLSLFARTFCRCPTSRLASTQTTASDR